MRFDHILNLNTEQRVKNKTCSGNDIFDDRTSRWVNFQNRLEFDISSQTELAEENKEK